MASSSKKTLPLSGENKPESGLRISALSEVNFMCNINPSDVYDLAKKPRVLKMLKKLANEMAKERDIIDESPRSVPVKLMKELNPRFDLEQYIEETRKLRRRPGFIKAKEDFINSFKDPPMSLDSETPVDVNNLAGSIDDDAFHKL